MLTFIMLTRISPGALHAPRSLEELEKEVMERIRSECEDVTWVYSYTLLSRHDYLDIFRAPDIDTALQVATIIRSLGHAHTEVWPAIDWGHFKDLIRDLSAGEAAQP